ncbi:unnamed protein product [Urochloa decumbens]|uniref:UBC core domain-containing protein n=1 Tax=Urochloa decumbens TaxID=240449 RepID=A0ABC8Z9I9_9POAL
MSIPGEQTGREGAHSEHGVVVIDDDTPEGKVAVLRVGRVVAHADPGDITVVDRSSLFRGQMVLLASYPGGQAGVVIVTSVHTALDLAELHLHGGAAVAAGVPAGDLRRVTSLVHGDYVVSGPWLGRVVHILDEVDVLFDDGCVCRVDPAVAHQLEVVVGEDLNTMRRNMSSLLYPGQRVCAAAVATGQESVFQASQWFRRRDCRRRNAHVEGTVAKVEIGVVFVRWVASAHLGTDQDLLRESAPQAMIWMGRRLPHPLTFFDSGDECCWAVTDRCFFRRRDHHHRRRDVKFERPMSVAGMRTTADVLWQDGTRQHGLPSTSLAPFHTHVDEFVPGHRVVRLAAAVDAAGDKDGPAIADANGAAARSGVVRSLDVADQTVRVSWLKAAAPGEEPSEVECDETVSAYDLNKDLDHDIFYGDIVIRRRHGGSESGGRTEATAPATQGNQEVVGAVADDLSWVGRVVDICDAYVQVKWGNGNTSKQDNGGSNVDDEEDNNDNSALITNCGQEGVVHVDDCVRKEKIAGGVANGDGSFHFVQFDMVQSPSDHHYLEDTSQGIGGGKKWTKRVQKEWKILENCLPETIYVLAFEDRMDLLRAAMVGAAGTPYQDGLFFFDMQLPPCYPAMPPQVCYRSFGLRVNPNLDKSGTVCLSLLDTFAGEGTELWSPASSTLLQVLVSIQGLVLTEQPYYNETGYEEMIGKPEGARNALPYGENVYVLNLRTMLHLLRRPPAGFEALVRDHFRRRARFVLRACETYMQGCPIGMLDADARTTAAESGQRPCSAGLRLALTGILPRLVEVFTEIDADGCEQFDRLRDSLGAAPPPYSPASN